MIISRKGGFTLIELLITITIIAVLSLIAITSYITFTKNARNAKRQSDLKFIQSALEEYFADQRFYPGSIASGESLTNATGNPTTPSPIKTYLGTVPKDPLNADYLYESRLSNTSYCLFTKFEGTPLTSSPGCTSSDSTYTYGITRP